MAKLEYVLISRQKCLLTLAHVLQRRMSYCPSHQGRQSRPYQALWWAIGLIKGKK